MELHILTFIEQCISAFLCSSTLSGTNLFLPLQTGGGGAKISNTRGAVLGSTFLLQLTRKFSLVGSQPPFWGGNFTFFVAVSACLFRQSTWRCWNSPRKKSREFPPVCECFLTLVTDASVGRVCSCHHARPTSTRNSFSKKKKQKVRMELHILSFIEQCSGLQLQSIIPESFRNLFLFLVLWRACCCLYLFMICWLNISGLPSMEPHSGWAS